MPRAITLITIGFVALFIFAGGAGFLWARQFEGRIAPNVFIGPIAVGGMRPELARQWLQSQTDDLLINGIPVTVKGETKNLSLSTLVSSDSIEDVEFALDEALEQAMDARRSSNPITKIWRFAIASWQPVSIPIPLTIATDTIKQNLIQLFPEQEIPGQDARFLFLQDEHGWQVRIVPGTTGTEFDWEPFFVTLSEKLGRFDRSEIALSLVEMPPSVSEAQAESQKDKALEKLLAAPLTFSYIDERGEKNEWILSQTHFAKMIVPSATETVQIDKSAFDEFLDPIAREIERPAQNARLQVENGRVVEFLESKSGLRLDRDALYELIMAGSGDPAYELVFTVEEPTVQTGDVNDLGIDQILGVGTSSYRGSPVNRRKNIQNGVDLLNGLLVAPGTTFSLLDALKPFDVENGYLPELVIKGNKITPELGGGLCQIGTTTFRATMNSGLPVTERRNHSLVVSYYNDPSNKNPGTDATIYDPAPDFKFTNDTGNYILFQAENLVETQELRFTFWGTSDGRLGSYTPPVVERWIPVGETQYIETTDLEPGKEKCQESHIGADASFDYTIVRPDGTVETQTFASHYRPLPRMCLVGVEKIEPQESTEPNETTQTVPVVETAP